MGKYKQWLHHQEVGARLRDEIAAHEAERERVLKLAPTKQTSLPDLSNPIIAALLGQASLAKASEPAKASRNGSAATTAAPAPEPVAAAAAAKPSQAAAPAEAAPVETTPKVTDKLAPAASGKLEAPAQKESVLAKAAASVEAPAKPKAATAPAKPAAEKPTPEPVAAAAPGASAPEQPDTIDPLLEQLLAHAESAPADPLEALNLLASQGPNLTRGEAPSVATLPTAPLAEPASISQSSALNTLLSEAKTGPEATKRAVEASSSSGSVAVGVEAIATAEIAARSESAPKVEKKRSDTDELVASRPTEGYTEPRLIVPQWLKNMEITQGQDGEKGEADDGDSEQRFSVSLPFENEEDMRLHESVERWWQRWRQQS